MRAAAAPAEAPAADVAPAPAVEAEPAKPAAAVEPAKDAPAAEPAGMAAVRKQEQHLRKQLATERATMQAEFDTQRTEWQAKVARAEAIDRAAVNARKDPIGAIKALGFTEADFDQLGRLVYGASPEGQKNPATKAAAEDSLRKHETTTELQKLQRELAELKNGLTAKEQAAQTQAMVDSYIGDVTKAVTDATPLARSALAKAPGKTKQALVAIADRLYVESGPSDDLREVPEPSEVLAEYERMRAGELEELGIDPKTIGKPAAAPVTRPAATLAPGGASPTVAKPPAQKLTRAELLAQIAKRNAVAG